MSALAIALGTAFATSLLATWLVLVLVRRWQMLDRPKAWSAHQVPMPTGGGLAVVAGFWAGWAALEAGGWEVSAWRPALLGGSAVLLGALVDDWVRPLRVGEKTGLLLLASGAWLFWAGPLESVVLPLVGRVELGGWGWPLTLFWFLWLCNVFNFMDGIDGLSAVQTMATGTLLALGLWQVESPIWPLGLLLAVSAAGFLPFNAPPARLFMGDTGSLFVGFAAAALGAAGQAEGLPLWVLVAGMGYYLSDTSYTLVRRALRGENVLRAHRKHLYQRLDKGGWSHLRIDLWALGITLLMAGGAQAAFSGARAWGAGLWGLGALVLLLSAAWIERKDPGFAG